MEDNYIEMSPEEFQELVKDFLDESEKHIQVLNEKLLQAESFLKQGKEMSQEDLNAMFRAAHTIKGTASFIKLNKIETLTHEMETILQRIKEKKMPLTMEIVDVLFRAFDTLEGMVESLKDSGEEIGEIEDNVNEIRAILEGKKNIDKVSEEESKKPSNEKYLKQFLVESYENIEGFSNTLVSLEENKNDTSLVNDLFRYIHTIKGSCGIVDADSIHNVTHSMENLLGLIREGKLDIDDNIISLLFEGTDLVKSLLDCLKEGTPCKSEDEVREYCEKLENIYKPIKESSNEKSGEKTGTPASEEIKSGKALTLNDFSADVKEKIDREASTGKSIFSTVIELKKNIPARDMKLLIGEERISKKGKILYEEPNSMDLAAGENPDEDKNVFIVFSTDDKKNVEDFFNVDGVELKDMVKIKGAATDEDKELSEKKAKTESKQTTASKKREDKKSAPIEISTIRVDSHKIDNLMNLSGELIITRARFSQLVSELNSYRDYQREIMYVVENLLGTSEEFSKISKNLLEDLQNESLAFRIEKLLGNLNKYVNDLHLKINKFANTNIINALDEVTSNLGKIASDIQSGVMQTRMIPVEGIFNRFKRVVRDISKQLGKNVVLRLEGEDTELDKKIVDSLSEPLTHMIRNAVDHGIEDAETRKKLGKPVEGTIFLRAYHKGNSFCVEVSDDGKGLDADKIAESALKKGLVTADQIEKMTEKEKLNLIFTPGFSTAEKVTGISGRGVGMDVVKNMISAVNGIIEINTEVGVGTTFILKIPLTLAIIQALLVEVSGEIYAFPFDTVVEIIKVSENEIYSIDGNRTIKLRGHVLGIVDFEKIFGIKVSNDLEDNVIRIVVVTNGVNQIGIQVDKLIGGEEIVIKSLTEHFSRVSGIMGASILGDGRIALIIDPFSVIKSVVN